MVQRDRCRSARSSWRLTILFFDVFVPAPPRADLGAPAPGACLRHRLDSLGQTLQRGPHLVFIRRLEPVDFERFRTAPQVPRDWGLYYDVTRNLRRCCLLYTSDAADEEDSVDL